MRESHCESQMINFFKSQSSCNNTCHHHQFCRLCVWIVCDLRTKSSRIFDCFCSKCHIWRLSFHGSLHGKSKGMLIFEANYVLLLQKQNFACVGERIFSSYGSINSKESKKFEYKRRKNWKIHKKYQHRFIKWHSNITSATFKKHLSS